MNRANRFTWLVGPCLGLAFFFLYWYTLCPTVFWYDSAEYVAAAFTLGIPHPPGYPLYTLLGRLFLALPFEPAYAMNLMSAVFGGLCVALCCQVGRQLGARPLAAAAGAATLGAGHVFWNQAIITEVYTPALSCALLVLLLVLHGLQHNRARSMLLAAGLAGLGLGLHLSIATCGLGYGLLVLGLGLSIERPAELRRLISREQLRRRALLALGCLGVAALAACAIFVYVPLRAAMNPALNFQNPSTWGRFLWFVTGGNYKTWFSDFPLWPRALKVLGLLYGQLLLVGLVLVLVGLLHLGRRQPLHALALALMAAGNIGFFFNYRVHDVEVFFLPAIAALALLVAQGTEAVLAGLQRLPTGRLGRGPLHLARAALLCFPLSLVVANFSAVSLRGYTSARDYGEALSAELPPRALILNFTTPAEWKNDAVFADYFQLVLDRRRDVRVVQLWTDQASFSRVVRLLQRGRAVYLYAPVPWAECLFDLVQEGKLYRLQRARPDPCPGAREWLRAGGVAS